VAALESNVAHDALVLPGATEAPVQSLPNLPAGDTFIASTTPQAFTGTITSSVYSDPGVNSDFPLGTQGLDFVYVITNNAGSMDQINQLTVSSFGTFQTGIDYVTGAGTLPTSADRLSNGHAIDFYFGPTELPQGGSSDWLLVETNATNYGTGFGSAIDGGSGTTFASVPVNGVLMSVPEPASIATITVVGAFVLGRRRRK